MKKIKIYFFFLLLPFILKPGTSDSLLKLISKTKNDTQKVLLYVELGDLFAKSNLDSASVWCSRAEILSDKNKYVRGKILALNLAARVSNLKGKPNQGEILNRLALNLCKEPGFIFESGKIYMGLAESYRLQGKYDSSQKYFSLSVANFETTKNLSGLANAYNGLGIVMRRKARLSEALQLFEKAVAIRKKIGPEYLKLFSMMNVAMIYDDMEDREKAIALYKEIAVDQRRIKDMSGLGNTMNNLGTTLYALEKYDEALEAYKEMLEAAEKTGNTRNLGVAYNNMATIFIQKKNFAEAERLMGLSYEIKKQINDIPGMASTLANLGEMLSEKEDFSGALQKFNEALKLNLQSGEVFQTQISYLNIATCYENLGKYKEAYENFQLYKNYSDTIFSLENNKTMKELQAKYETEKQQKEIEQLAKEGSTRELLLTKKKNQFYIVSAFALLIISILLVFYFLNRIRQQKEINKKNEELSNVKESRQKEIIDAIVSTEEKQRKKLSEDLHDGLGQLLTAVKINLQNAIDSNVNEIPKMQAVIKASFETISDAVYETKNMALNLLPLDIKENGLVNGLQNFCVRTSKLTGIEIGFQSFNVPSTLPSLLEINSYRICQEILNNATKHSKATKINLQLFGRDEKLIIQAEDNGKGFDIENVSGRGMGMRTFRERVKVLNGEIEITSSVGNGTEIFVEFPIAT